MEIMKYESYVKTTMTVADQDHNPSILERLSSSHEFLK
jgi:hypothetical protein